MFIIKLFIIYTVLYIYIYNVSAINYNCMLYIYFINIILQYSDLYLYNTSFDLP